jgi:hypothetical protein
MAQRLIRRVTPPQSNAPNSPRYEHIKERHPPPTNAPNVTNMDIIPYTATSSSVQHAPSSPPDTTRIVVPYTHARYANSSSPDTRSRTAHSPGSNQRRPYTILVERSPDQPPDNLLPPHPTTPRNEREEQIWCATTGTSATTNVTSTTTSKWLTWLENQAVISSFLPNWTL